MSQQVDVCKTCIMFALSNNLPLSKAVDLYQSLLGDLEADEETYNSARTDIIHVVNYMLTQQDGLYGVSHQTLNQELWQFCLP